ncbi:MAG: SDR family oxidoreductase [Chitinophagaceae bacterium]
MKKIWFITEASKGLGLTLMRRLIQEGYKVAGTSRDLDELKRSVGGVSPDFLPLMVDLLDEDSVARALYDTVRHFGGIDVIVNSAKYGLAGSIEELSDAETRRNFDVNVFGTLNVIRGALPFLREQGSGHIFNVSSIGGFTGAKEGFGIYRATELAVLGFSESLAAEVRPFGIDVTVVVPAYFRSGFTAPGLLVVPKRKIADYRPIKEIQNLPLQGGGSVVELEKAAMALLLVGEQEDPPLFLFLGQNVSDLAAVRTRPVERRMEGVRDLVSAAGLAV